MHDDDERPSHPALGGLWMVGATIVILILLTVFGGGVDRVRRASTGGPALPTMHAEWDR